MDIREFLEARLAASGHTPPVRFCGRPFVTYRRAWPCWDWTVWRPVEGHVAPAVVAEGFVLRRSTVMRAASEHLGTEED